MAHKPLYTFSIINNRVLQFKHNTSTQIARLHSFSNTKSKNIFTNTIVFHDNLLACSNHDGEIVVVNIFTRKKYLIQSEQDNINTLHFLNKSKLVVTNINGFTQVHDLKTNSAREITEPSILTLLRKHKNINLDTLSCSVLTPLIDKNSLVVAFGLIDDNPMLRTTLEHNKLQEMYRLVFEKAIEALRNGNSSRANKLLENFKDVGSKTEQITALFIDFKHYDRFKLHVLEKKYSIAYALCSKHSLLTLTPEYEKMEDIYKGTFKTAREQMLMGQKDLATDTLSKYMTILSKRDEVKSLLCGDYSYDNPTKLKDRTDLYNEKLLHAYEKNNFKECYELIDRYAIENIELVTLLEKHWIKLMIECEDYALDGNVKAIKAKLKELISTKTRADKIGDLLRVAFHSKIKTLQEGKKFTTAENIIYSYIDIFGPDIEIKEIMKEFQKRSFKTLAITQNEKVLRDNWLNAALIVEY